MAKNLDALFQKVQEIKADIGLALDGDATVSERRTPRVISWTAIGFFAILLLHLVERRGWRGPVVKTVSTTSMIDLLCEQLNLPLTITPIGFKYICENMLQRDILIGGEESGGIGIRQHLPERDGRLDGFIAAGSHDDER